MFGYNGFGRLTGNENGSVGGGAAGADRSGAPTGLTRLFNTEFGGQISWLLPAALILLVAGLAVTLRAAAHRPHARRAAALGWLARRDRGCCSASARGSSIPTTRSHSARRSARVVGIGAVTLWSHRSAARAVHARRRVLAATVVWSYALLDRTPSVAPVVADRAARSAASVVGGRDARVAVPPAAHGAGRGGRRGRGRVARTRRVHGRDRGDAAHRCDPVGRPDGRRPPASDRAAVRGRRRSAARDRRRVRPAAARRLRRHVRRRCGFAGLPGAGCGAGIRRSRRPAPRPAAVARRARRSAQRHDGERALKTAARREPLAATRGSRRPSTRTTPRATNSRPAQPVMAIGGFNGTDPSPDARAVRARRRRRTRSTTSSAAAAVSAAAARAARAARPSSAITLVGRRATSPRKTVGGVTVYDLTPSRRTLVEQRGIGVERFERLEAVGAVARLVAPERARCSG